VRRIVAEAGTPCYIYSARTFEEHFKRIREAFEGMEHLICFSVKSNANLTLLSRIIRLGAGMDIVSGGELFKAMKAGADPAKTVYASVGKTEDEIREAVRAGILFFNVESEAELEVINRVACRESRIQQVAVRINPDVKAKTHTYITTGAKENKFGLDMETAFRVYMESYRYPFLKFAGVHLHIGSQILEGRPFSKALRRAADFVMRLNRAGVFIATINIGGGLGIRYASERPQTALEFARAVRPILEKINVRLILEPGRFISGNAGILATKLLYWKESRWKRFAIVDAGMNDLMRPAMYDAYHEIQPVKSVASRRAVVKNVDVVGPICESGDYLGKGRSLPRLRPGEILAVMSAGAYVSTMASNYNARCRACEVVVRGSRFKVTRRREVYEDLVRGEKVARF